MRPPDPGRHPVVVHLAHLRRNAGLTQTEVAERAGLRAQQISLWERGDHSPRLHSLALWASALDLHITTGEVSC
ncbi:helix-turn-helix transcriptional regulator [Pseudonocardia sp.]|uniref:helix-turn-helix domain-containing protein n=1 Tax=Pseudonocardia sp. TaxID=60912 RepID=UPI00260C8AA2|nr:helix-turn-helix transcriptional regulator [Pseudonocardia sp.]MCW2720489.1 helix-turn-helix protein [Pseudonocardia sp.]